MFYLLPDCTETRARERAPGSPLADDAKPQACGDMARAGTIYYTFNFYLLSSITAQLALR
jgi:hypothetical protein